ncbi:MAG: NAD(P)-dependent glycerol-3-phosphate dehydrogenase [Oscillospiraceae bacterium]|nr:NAD(P)-dependent glycerol-3-phosphate dehydrogenase [Oscillospiraceae bacterium]
MRISVLGSGAWGTALAALLAKNKHKVTLRFLTRPHAEVVPVSGESRCLSGVRLPDSLELQDGLEGVSDAEMVVLAPPSYAMRWNAEQLRGVIADDTVIVSASKGIEISSGLRLTQVIEDVLGNSGRIAVLSGPSHAEEVARGVPTGCVSASTELATARLTQDAFMCSDFRVYTSTDVIGAELCGALKNVIAIAVGISDGCGYGDNTKAMLMTRGLAEVSRLGERLGGNRETFSGLAGVGDLIVTCTSQHSRNRRAGLNIGNGMSVQEAMDAVGAVVEGYYAAAAAVELAKRFSVEMPIATELHKVLYDGKNPKIATAHLMEREKKGE